MDVGIHVPIFDIDGGTTAIAGELASVGAAVEASGANWLSFMDHFFQIEPTGLPAEPNMLEGYTTLGFLAAHTRRVSLGLLVTGVTYRHPGLLAKTVTTLDVLSGGRAVLGIGAAWYEREHRGLGVPFPPWPSGSSGSRRRCRSATRCGSDDNGPFEGKHYQLARDAVLAAADQPAQVMIGGSGERKTLRLVAQYGDACNLFASSPEEVAHKLDVLRRHCDDVGRDYDEIRKTVTANNPRHSAGDARRVRPPDGRLRRSSAWRPRSSCRRPARLPP